MHANIVVFKKAGQFDDPLTYSVPSAMEFVMRPGRGVSALLNGHAVKGIVVEVMPDAPEKMEASKIKALEEFFPEADIPTYSIVLARHLSDYYRTSLTRTLKLMVPSTVWKASQRKRARKSDTQENMPDYSQFPLTPLKKLLTEDQAKAVEEIRSSKKPVLLHGITGSGKTEIYLHLILDAVRAGKQAILLVPEIALTPQMIDYFKSCFGSHIALFHSKMTEGQRAKEWQKAKSGYAPLIIGSRSAVFAPAPNLGLIIIDEEHEWTYKQESAPYYETAHVAETLRDLTGVKLIMGSATPRIESLYKAKLGQYTYLHLHERVNKLALPEISIVDLRDEFKQKNFSIFSRRLQNKIRERLSAKEQIILFVNQRGMARAVVCRDCGYTEKCPNCDVALKLHGGIRPQDQKLVCHYCGFTKSPPLTCPSCHSPYIKHMGIGTERVEEEARRMFPEARIMRADSDTTKAKEGFEPIYRAFMERKFDILVGTQMVAKGLDFDGVTLIGIMLADIGLHIPDFRSHERLFQIITQVSGRAGRAEKKGEVVLQTYQPEHFAIQKAAFYDYDDFAESELKYRKELGYPPFARMIKFTVVGSDAEKLRKHIEVEQEILEDIFKVNSLDFKILSAPALIPKLSGQYYYHVLIRAENPHVIFNHWKPPKGWRVDVDPIHTV